MYDDPHPTSPTALSAQRFGVIKNPNRIWLIASIHGDADRLAAVHRTIDERLCWGDRIVYMGNYMGIGPQVRAVLDELVVFRRYTLARPGFFANDIIYLRGQQEEIWDKLLQLHFASDPRSILSWMLDHGLEATLMAYGSNAREATSYARQGVVELQNYTTRLRNRMRSIPGHYPLMMSLRRAAHTNDQRLLFVHAGINPTLPLDNQTDSFWWSYSELPRLYEPYAGFARIFSGWTPQHSGIEVYPFATAMDGGCGYGGTLLAGCINTDGTFVEIYQA